MLQSVRESVSGAIRRLADHPAASATSLVGLAVALAVAVLVGQLVYHETTFDAFHENADRIRRVVVTDAQTGITSAPTPAFLGTTMAETVPGVESVVRVRPEGTEVRFEASNGSQLKKVYREDVLYADPAFFDVFSFPLVVGRTEAFGPEGTTVLTEPVARALFGDGDPLGQIIRLKGGETLQVVGVTEPVSARSTIPFGAVISMATYEAATAAQGRPIEESGWDQYAYHTYALLRSPDISREAIEDATETAVIERAGSGRITERQIEIEPLRDARHGSAVEDGLVPPGRTAYLVVLVGVALLLLAVAGTTATNLTVARSLRNAREIGVRQALGATPWGVASMYLVEALVLSVAAVVVGFALARLALPAFQVAVGVPVEMRYSSPVIWGGILVLVLGTGLISGLYPALALSRLSPDTTLRGHSTLAGTWMRRGLVAFQFAATVFLIACAGVLALQLDYLRSADLGFDPKNVTVLPIRGSEAAQNADVYRHAVEALPQVSSVTVGKSVPAFFDEPGNSVVALDDPMEKEILVHLEGADAEYDKTLGLTVVAGRFIRDTAADSGRVAVINEAAAEALGWKDPIGKKLAYWGGRERTVVGVVRDFHAESPRVPINPVVFVPRSELWDAVIAVRSRPGVAGTRAALQAAWEDLYPTDPFEAHDLETAFAELTADEARLASSFIGFALVAVLIASLGLASLIAFTAERKRREIGVRAALGATEWDVARLLGAEFAPLLLTGLISALVVSAWAMRMWLEGFVTRISLGPGPFVAAGLIALAVAVGTIFWRGLIAARLNPADALRSE